MAQQADFTVYDGAATPVAHTLTGVGVERVSGSLVGSWRELLSTVPQYAQVTFMQTLTRLRSGVWRTVSRVEVPVMESISGQNAAGYTAAPKVAYVDRYELVGYHSPRSNAATKQIAWQMLLNRLNNVSTSVTPVTAGVSANLHLNGNQVT